MQNKGTLGSIIAGVIAIFLVLVCLFYLSFSIVGNHYESKADEYALAKAGAAGEYSDQFNKAKKEFLDSLNKEPIWMGYNYAEVQKWGVGLGLDLKGGMNVTLQISMPDLLNSMRNQGQVNDEAFDSALAYTDSIIDNRIEEDYVRTFMRKYRELNPNADFSVVFGSPVEYGMSDEEVISKVKAEVKSIVNNSATNVLRKRIDSYGVVSPNIQVLDRIDGQILLELPGVKDHQRVRDLIQRAANLEFYETYKLSEISQNLNLFDRALRSSGEEGEANGKGLYDYLAPYQGDSPAVGVASAKNREIIDSLLATPAAKTNLPSNLKLAWEVKPIEQVVTDTSTGKQRKVDYYTLVALKTTNGGPILDGSCVVTASAEQNNFHRNTVSMAMDSKGAAQWAKITAANVGRSVAIVLDDAVYSYPNVNGEITGGRSEISGQFSVEEAQDLASVLKSGKMTARVEIISDLVIGPSLGQQAIESGFISFIIALVLLMIFMLFYYGMIPGLVADLGLICNLFFTFGILSSFQAVLTMSGIAGIVLALGMAVDANVLIFERTKEELRAGKNVKNAINDGYGNAFSAIFDSNLTSIITALILMWVGSGPIKGFATTLTIGIICSFFTAVYLTRLVFIFGGNSKTFQSLTFETGLSRRIFKNSSIDFIAQRKKSFTIVGLLILAGVLSFFTRGLNQGIDFSGGRNYVVKFEQSVNPVELRDALAPEFEGSMVSVITIEKANQVRVSTNYLYNDPSTNAEQVILEKIYNVCKDHGYIASDMPIENFSATDDSQGIISSQKVGPTVANEMRKDAIIAVLLSLVAMFLYILIRFRNIAFSCGAVAAVAFTAFSIIAIYSFFWGILPFEMEVDQNFIAAILTVIGYQINDTVVVFDRVRENFGLYPKAAVLDTFNKSINSTLSRTIITSGTTLLVLLCIFFLGGDSLRSFIFAMTLGVIIGTLATIYIASPVAYLISPKKDSSSESSKQVVRK